MAQHNVIVTHGHCPDGAAAVVVAKKIDRNCEAIHGLHNHIDEQVLSAAESLREGGNLWMTDISCSEETLIKVFEILISKTASIGIYEHHITRNFLETVSLPEGLRGEIVFDLDRCGSRIFFETMRPRHTDQLDEYEDYITLTNDRDLWINSDIRSAELSTLHSILGEERFIARFLKDPSVEFTQRERVLLDYERDRMMRRMHSLIDRVEVKTDPEGLRYGVLVGEGKASEVCNAAIHKLNLEYVCMLDYNSGRASIRSHKVFDCAKFSEARGGGGHERAAGFPISTPNFQLYPEE